MYVCMYVCMYACIYVCMYCVGMYPPEYACNYAYTYKNTHAHIHIPIFDQRHVAACIYMCICVSTFYAYCMRIHTYASTQPVCVGSGNNVCKTLQMLGRDAELHYSQLARGLGKDSCCKAFGTKDHATCRVSFYKGNCDYAFGSVLAVLVLEPWVVSGPNGCNRVWLMGNEGLQKAFIKEYSLNHIGNLYIV